MYLLAGFVLLALGCVSSHDRALALARLDLGSTYLREGSVELATATLMDAAELDPRNVEVWNQLGLALMARGAPDAAEDAFKRGLRVDPDSSTLRVNYSMLLQRTGRSDEAIGHLEAALGDLSYRNPALVLNNLGVVHNEIGQPEKAERYLREATIRAPTYCMAWFNLGLSLEAQRRLDDAVEAFSKVNTLCPEDGAGSAIKAGRLLLEAGRTQEACPLFAMAAVGARSEPIGAEARTLMEGACPW